MTDLTLAAGVLSSTGNIYIGEVTIASKETEDALNFDKTDMYQIVLETPMIIKGETVVKAITSVMGSDLLFS